MNHNNIAAAYSNNREIASTQTLSGRQQAITNPKEYEGNNLKVRLQVPSSIK